MKYRILFLLSLFVSTEFATGANTEKEFYISLKGKKGNDGSKEHPFLLFEEARDAVRKCKKERPAVSKITVWIREGIYERTSCFELTDEDSGNENLDILYQAYPGEQVKIMGAKTIPVSAVKSITDAVTKSRIVNKEAYSRIRVIDLKELGITNYGTLQITGFRRPYVNPQLELFINDQPYFLARYPNKGKIRILEDDIIDQGTIDSPAKIKFLKNKLKQWSQADHIFTGGNYAYAWSTDQLRIKSTDTLSGVISFADTHMFPVLGKIELNQYYFFNLLEELDDPGEYFVDQEGGKLYFYPFQDLKPTDSIVVSLLDRPMVSVKGADYIHFKNIHFGASRGIGIYMENTDYNTIENCVFQNQGVVAVCIGKGSEPYKKYFHPKPEKQHVGYPMVSEQLGSLHEHMYVCSLVDREAGHHNGIIGCTIQNTGCGGISLGGGNRANLEAGENYVLDCEFNNCGRIDYSYKSPVNIDGVGNKVQHCQFTACPATAVYIHGNNHLVEYNRFIECCNFMDDQGAIYLGRDPSEFGNTIRYNYFENIGIGDHMTMAVYCDDGACGTSIFGNIFYNAGTRTIMIGGGQYNKIQNNIFIDSKMAIHLDNRLQNWFKSAIEPGGIFDLRLHEVKYQQAPYATYYPELTNYFEDDPSIPKHNDICSNIFYQVEQIHNGESSWGPVHDENIITTLNPGFTDISKKDFRLSNLSGIQHQIPSFVQIPLSKIGRLK